MKNRFCLPLIASIILFLATCKSNEVTPSPDPGSIDYLMFGREGGFCIECATMYKMENGNLYGAKRQTINDPDTVKLSLLPSSSYKLVSSILSDIPPRLLTGNINVTQNLGTPFPDAGITYIEVSQYHKVYRWSVAGANIPSDVNAYVVEINNAMGQLN